MAPTQIPRLLSCSSSATGMALPAQTLSSPSFPKISVVMAGFRDDARLFPSPAVNRSSKAIIILKRLRNLLRIGWENRHWLPTAAWTSLRSGPVSSLRPIHFILAVADHFEPGIDPTDSFGYADHAEQVR